MYRNFFQIFFRDKDDVNSKLFSLANASDSPDQSVNNSGDEGRLSPNMPTMNHTDSETQQNKSLELENQLLKNEITSLNHEMTSVIARARESQDGRFMIHYFT